MISVAITSRTVRVEKSTMTDIFDWDKLSKELNTEGGTRDIIIDRAFQQYISGNSCYDESSSGEMSAFHHIFRTGWIIRETL